MKFRGINHLAMVTNDMEGTTRFYRDILGMRVTLDQVQDTTTGGLPYTYKHPRKTRRTVHVRYGEGNTIPSLVLTSHPGDTADGEPIKLDQVGISHLSFSVRDVKALAEELVAKGVQLAGPMDAFTNDQGGIGSIFVYDPDGILVQFDGGGGG